MDVEWEEEEQVVNEEEEVEEEGEGQVVNRVPSSGVSGEMFLAWVYDCH